MRTLRLFEVNIESDIAAPVSCPASASPTLRIVHDPTLQVRLAPLLSRPFWNPDGLGRLEVSLDGDATVLRIEPSALFACSPSRIAYRATGAFPVESLLWPLFGIVFAVWLEMKGSPVIHAAVVEIGGRAVGLLGRPGTGKSTFAAALMRRGHRLLGDDHLVIDHREAVVMAKPALPWLKVSSATARWLGHDPAALPSLHPTVAKRRLDLSPGAFLDQSLPVAGLYTLAQDPSVRSTSIVPLQGEEGFRELVRHSYAPRTMAAIGLDRGRLPPLARLLAQTPMREIRYPAGFEYLEDAAVALEADVMATWR